MVFKMEYAKDVWDKRDQAIEVTHTSVEIFQCTKSNRVSKRRPKHSISANGGDMNEYGYSYYANDMNDVANMVSIIIMKMVILLDPMK